MTAAARIFLLVLTTLVFLFASCRGCDTDQIPESAKAYVRIKAARTQRAAPLVFARFENFLLPTEKITPSLAACSDSEQFQHGDLCGPTPPKSKKGETDGGELNAWTLPKNPKAFYWQQPLKLDKTLVVEIIDGAGVPWPSRLRVTESDGLATAELIPEERLPGGETLYLRGQMVSLDNENKQTWSLPFQVSE